jgi:cyclophilin family peptidyl-prolyl cis-trans isomerase
MWHVQHGLEGLVSMAMSMDKKVDSRFFVNLSADAEWADGR